MIGIKYGTRFAVGALTTFVVMAQANELYPNRPLRFVVPAPPGGTVDLIARLTAPRLSEQLGKPVVVDNRAGAGGVVGVDHVAKSKPDGYTLVLNSATPMVTAVSLNTTPYDLFRDLTPITQVTTFDYVMSVNARSTIQSMQDLVQLARKDPGKLNYASAGIGSGQHMYVELMRSAAGIQIQHIPYKGNAPAMTEVMAGRVDFMFYPMIGVTEREAQKQIRILASTTAKRHPDTPQVPTMAELGFPGFEEYVGPVGFVAPAGTPQAILDKLATAIRGTLTKPAIEQRLKQLGSVVVASSPNEYRQWLRDDHARWAQLIKTANIKDQP